MNTFSVWLGGKERSAISKQCERTWPNGHEMFTAARLGSVCPWVRSIDYFRDAYAAGHWAGASDVARLAALLELGGAYVDCDVEIVDLARMDGLNDGLFHIGAEDRDGNLCGAVMIAPPAHPFVRHMIDVYKRTNFADTFNGKCNGTTLLTRNARDFASTMQVHQPPDFYPWHWGESLTQNQKADRIELLKPITAHHWERGWSQVNV